jgi:hypothetical protein
MRHLPSSAWHLLLFYNNIQFKIGRLPIDDEAMADEQRPPEDGESSPTQKLDLAEDKDRKTLERWRLLDVVLSFGPNGTFFVSTSPETWRYWVDRYIACVLDTASIKRVAAVALTPELGVMICYEDSGGKEGTMSIQTSPGPNRTVTVSADELAMCSDIPKQRKLIMYDFLRKTKDIDRSRDMDFTVGANGS